MINSNIMEFLTYAGQQAYKDKTLWFGFHGATWKDMEWMTRYKYRGEPVRIYNSINVHATGLMYRDPDEIIYMTGTSAFPIFHDFDFNSTLDSFRKAMNYAVSYGTCMVCLIYGDHITQETDGISIRCNAFEGSYVDTVRFFTQEELGKGGMRYEKESDLL